jgi:hypothetical protein
VRAAATCDFSGTITVDAVGGVTGIDTTFPGLSPFDTAFAYVIDMSLPQIFNVEATNNPGPDLLNLNLAGGTMKIGDAIESFGSKVLDRTGKVFYENFSGAVAPSAVPEPSAIILLASALVAVGFVTLRRRASRHCAEGRFKLSARCVLHVRERRS